MLATIGFIIALALALGVQRSAVSGQRSAVSGQRSAVSGQSWMVIAVVAFLMITLAVVVLGLYGMLDEDDDEHSG